MRRSTFLVLIISFVRFLSFFLPEVVNTFTHVHLNMTMCVVKCVETKWHTPKKASQRNKKKLKQYHNIAIE